MRTHSLVIGLLLAAPAIAQKADLTIDQKQDATLRVNIQAQFDVSQTNKTLMDGEEANFGRGGRGGGGTGDMVLTQAIVFDRGPASAGWREYLTLETTTDRGGQASKVQGALAGQRVFLRDGALYRGEGADAEAVPANLSTGMPGRVALTGLIVDGEVSVGDDFDISDTFLPAFRGLLHPVTPEGAARGGRGGGRGGRGGGRGGRGGRGGGDVATTFRSVLESSALQCKASGKLVSIDGDTATVELEVALTGEGTAEELGMGRGRGRGGRGGGGGGGASKASASIVLTGTATVNLPSSQLDNLQLGGAVELNSDTTRSTGRGEFQTISGTKGTVKITVACEAVSG